MSGAARGDTAAGAVLVLNCGSSSIKFALFDAPADGGPPARQPRFGGRIEGITGSSPRYCETGAAPEPVPLDAAQPYHAALDHIRARVARQQGGRSLRAVAHRVVHGGALHFAPVAVDPPLLAELRGYIPLAPLHQPFALDAIETMLAAQPQLAQIACFDTGFHRTMPAAERLLALPWSAWERGVRRYGFHGLSYEYQSIALAERHGDAARGRTVVAHLGSGASLCAMQGLASVATSMGFSALDGLMMGTRCGALDPGVLLYYLETEHLSPARLGELLYHESGLLGVSGVSSDPRELLRHEATNPRAAAALALYVRRIVREVGGLVALLGGLEMLAFTAGIGEHNAELRARVVAGLGFVGARLDADANARHAPVVSAADSRVLVVVEPTNEEWIAARDALRLTTQNA
jgi:acetate kinase